MFFVLSKILTIFIFPLPFFLTLSLIFSFFIQEKKIRFGLFFCLLSLWIFSTFFVSQFLIHSLEKNYPPKKIHQLETVDAIVVLGGMLNQFVLHKNQIELLSSADRLTDAIYLFFEKKAKIIVYTGGSGSLFHQDISEGQVAKKFFLRFKIPKENFIIEAKSRNTIENAIYTKEILQKHKIKSILLITSAFHMRRALESFHSQGIKKIISYPTDYRSLERKFTFEFLIPSVGGLENSTIAIKEWIGLLAYKIFYLYK